MPSTRARRLAGSGAFVCYTACVKIPSFPMTATDWSRVPKTEHPGESGTAFWQSETLGEIRVRMVEYSAGYLADHWCSKGHILLCLEGELETELADGRMFTLQPGMSYQAGDGDPPHRSATKGGAKLFVVD
jgi:hypothetical protein